jgi:excisionase family DNA binding protein
MAKPEPKLLTVDEAQGQLGISRDKIYELMSGGELAFVKLPPGTKHAGRRIEQAEINAFIERNRQRIP